MDNRRLALHAILCEIVNIKESDGDEHVYFDPPASIKMRYPAIRYARKKIEKVYANNSVYRKLTPYEIVVIDSNPDSDLIDKILQLPYCEHDRHYKAENLNHDVFTIYY